MTHVNGTPTNSLDLKGFRHVSDLIYYDGPILSYFQDVDGESYLFSWVDCDDTYNRWLIISTDFANVMMYVKREISLRSIVLSDKAKKLYLVDIDADINYHHLQCVRLSDLPQEYIPPTDALYAYEPQNSEKEFLEKLNAQGEPDGNLKLIGKFDMLNAKTGLYRFADMYSQAVSYGYFVRPQIDSLLDLSFRHSYMIVVSRQQGQQHSEHKATDKIVSVEPVYAS